MLVVRRIGHVPLTLRRDRLPVIVNTGSESLLKQLLFFVVTTLSELLGDGEAGLNDRLGMLRRPEKVAVFGEKATVVVGTLQDLLVDGVDVVRRRPELDTEAVRLATVGLASDRVLRNDSGHLWISRLYDTLILLTEPSNLVIRDLLDAVVTVTGVL